MTLAERLDALHETLRDAAVPHAFGGAIALAFWTLDPRGTRDLDVNVFVAAGEVLARLPEGIIVPADADEVIVREGQMRLWWDDTPVDLFFDYAPIHANAARQAQRVPFAGAEIPVLGPVELTVFKAMFDRTKDWAILAARSASVETIRAGLRPMLDDENPR